ncbi:MAG: hypothetical protein ABFD91_04100 [Anaerohalosphaeraceae bacterium]
MDCQVIKINPAGCEGPAVSIPRGVCPNNIPPSNPKTTPIIGLNGIKKRLGSEDRVVLSLYVNWGSDEAWNSIEEYLDACKEAAQNGDIVNDHFTRKEQAFDFNFEVHPNGKKTGGRVGPLYAWRMDSGGVRLAIARTRTPKKEMPNVIVDCGSLFLMCNGGIRGGWEIVRAMIHALGGEILEVKVSRVDLCVDLVGWDINEITKDFFLRKYVSRARLNSMYRNGWNYTGFSCGKGMVFRLYDKLEETERQPEKRQVLIAERWGGTLPDEAIRAEFQVDRQTLKERGIDTLDDYIEKAYSLSKYLCKEWFRMTDDVPEVGHQERSITSEFWELVSAAFLSWTKELTENPKQIERRVKTEADPSALARQSVGCITSIAACTGIQFESEAQLRRYIFSHVDAAVSERLDVLGQLMKKKARVYNSKVPNFDKAEELDFVTEATEFKAEEPPKQINEFFDFYEKMAYDYR